MLGRHVVERPSVLPVGVGTVNGPLRLLAVLAHPDDESLGVGGILAHSAAEGVETHVLTATRGQSGRYFHNQSRPSDEEVGRARESELRAAAEVLGVRSVTLLDYQDGRLHRVDAREATTRIAAHVRAVRPHVIVTFAPDGAYGHPDHIAISQLAAGAALQAADPAATIPAEPHTVSKFYYFAWPAELWALYQRAFKRLVSVVDGVERQANPWPQWMLTTHVDTRAHWRTVWRAVQCHASQLAVYQGLSALTEQEHATLWGSQYFCRVFSLVNGGGTTETDLFAGLRPRV